MKFHLLTDVSEWPVFNFHETHYSLIHPGTSYCLMILANGGEIGRQSFRLYIIRISNIWPMNKNSVRIDHQSSK